MPSAAADIRRERQKAARAARIAGTLSAAGSKFVFPAQMGHDPATSWSAYVDRNVEVSGDADLLR